MYRIKQWSAHGGINSSMVRRSEIKCMETHVRTFKFMSIPQFTVSKNVCVSGGVGGGGEYETNSVLETFLSRQLTVTSI